MNGTSEQADILPPNCMVKDRWKVVSRAPKGLTRTEDVCLMLSSSELPLLRNAAPV